MTGERTRDRLIDVLVRSLGAAGLYNGADRTAPVAILWPDPERLWSGIIPALRSEHPILTLGAYEPSALTGPAIWIRWWFEHEAAESADPVIPIVYLPGVDRASLRAVETVSAEIKPLVELQFRSSWWQQSNGSPWTPAGFAKSPDGAALDVRADAATRDAITPALAMLAVMQLDQLRDRRIDAAFVNGLMLGDPEKRLLQWIDAEAACGIEGNEWAAFVATCKKTYKFDPGSDGALVAANNLGNREGAWAHVWERFAESPTAYPSIPGKLRQARDLAGLPVYADSWPQDNEAAETDLRALFYSLGSMSHSDALSAITKAEQEHGTRRVSVWGRLRQTSLADALAGLAQIATACVTPAPSTTFRDFEKWYLNGGVLADSGVIDALAAVADPADRASVEVAVRGLYLAWSDFNARVFQGLVKAESIKSTTGLPTSKGDCVLFVDGLRLDIGLKLEAALLRSGAVVELKTRMAPIPSMTSSGKPAVTPMTGPFAGGSEFYPSANGKKLDSGNLKTLMQTEGVKPFSDSEYGDPTGRGWTEAADLDALGHKVGLKLADQVDKEVAGITARVRGLLATGWNRVHVVTDHGWLLMPGTLPKVELDINKTTVRKTRAARLAEHTAGIDQPEYPWTWDASVRVAVPIGIAAFEAGKVYEHGGVSPQESIVPHLIVTAAGGNQSVEISAPKWTGLRCRVTVSGAVSPATVGLRVKAADPSTSLAGPKEISAEGVSLLVEDDKYLDAAAYLVVLAQDGTLLAQRPVVVGGE